MAAPAPTKAQVCAEVADLLARALGRLMRAEADGTLTPTEARVMREIRAEMAERDVSAATAA